MVSSDHGTIILKYKKIIISNIHTQCYKTKLSGFHAKSEQILMENNSGKIKNKTQLLALTKPKIYNIITRKFHPPNVAIITTVSEITTNASPSLITGKIKCIMYEY